MNSLFWRDTEDGKRGWAERLRGVAAGVVCVCAAGGLYAAEIVTMGGKDISGAFEPVYAIEGRVQYEISGASVIREELRRVPAEFEWQGPQGREMIKAFLLWGGNVNKGEGSRAKRVVWMSPSGKKTRLTAARYYEETSGGETIYSAMAEITPHLKEAGSYRILDMRTRKDRFGGFAVALVYKNPSAAERSIRLYWGVSRLRPGEMYHVRLLEPKKKVFVTQVSTIGGGAIAGNGSSNSLNQRSLSGKEDWDGSSGYRWDVDHYQVNRKLEGLTWSMDPLLQWVFPMGIMVQIDQTRE